MRMTKMQVPFDFAQGRLSTPLKNASLRMTASVDDRFFGCLGLTAFIERTLESGHKRETSG